MEIKLGKYFIRSDRYQFILSEKKKREKGKNIGEEYWDDLGYYPKIEYLLTAYRDLFVRESDIQTLHDLIAAYSNVDTTIRELALQTAYKEAK